MPVRPKRLSAPPTDTPPQGYATPDLTPTPVESKMLLDTPSQRDPPPEKTPASVPSPPPRVSISIGLAPAGAATGPSPHDPRQAGDYLVGKLIDGRYRVTRVLGGGGMAAVFEGEQVSNGRPVAVKVLPFQMANNRESHKRFFNEARLTASLSNANICSIYDYGTLDDGRPYYVMERLRGHALSHQIKEQGVLALLDAVEIVMQVLSGLRTAHNQGVIHRDVKPANVFLHERADGKIQVKLLDFGVAKDVGRLMGPCSDDTTQLTHTGYVMGTPYYLSPEQILGTRDIDARVDLWAVGVMLYECIVGKRPFLGRNFPELASRIAYDAHRPMWERRPATPELLQQVVDRALAKAPENRYQKASTFLRDLQVVRMALLNENRSSP